MAPEPFNDLTPENAASAANLPALIPSANALIRRTQTTLVLLNDVVQESSVEHWFERGRLAEANTRWAEAAYAYRRCVERDAENWRAEVRLAGALGQLGQAEEAARVLNSQKKTAIAWNALVAELPKSTWQLLRDCLEAARSTARDGFALLLGLAQVYRVLDQGEQARRTLDVMQFMYQQQVAGSAQWFRLSAKLHHDATLHLKAIADCDRAIELTPTNDLAYAVRGIAKEALLDYVGAIADYNRAIELNSTNAPTYNNRGNLKVKMGDYNGGIADYSCAIELNLDFPMVHSSRGDAKQKLKDYAGAIADYDRFLELKPTSAFAYRKRGSVKHELLDYAGAIADFDRAIALKPDDPVYCYFRGDTKSDLKDYAGAIADYDRAIEIKPEDSGYYFARGYAKERMKNYAGAIADYDLVITLEPTDANYYRFRAETKEKLGDKTGAAADREKEAQLTAITASH